MKISAVNESGWTGASATSEAAQNHSASPCSVARRLCKPDSRLPLKTTPTS